MFIFWLTSTVFLAYIIFQAIFRRASDSHIAELSSLAKGCAKAERLAQSAEQNKDRLTFGDFIFAKKQIKYIIAEQKSGPLATAAEKVKLISLSEGCAEAEDYVRQVLSSEKLTENSCEDAMSVVIDMINAEKVKNFLSKPS